MDSNTYGALFPNLYEHSSQYTPENYFQRKKDEEAANQPPPETSNWNSPTAGVEGGANWTTFGQFQMTPDSPSVNESNHWNYYQDQPKEGDDNIPPTVDPLAEPGTALAASTAVRAKTGGGTGSVQPREVPKPQAIAHQAQQEQAQQVMFDMNKIPKWNESKAIGHGLLSFGLNLLSGNDLATSFNQAGQRFDQAYGREKREIWAQDLASQGFDAHEIQAWLETGDHKALSDPMEKKAKMQAMNIGAQQLAKATRENDPEYIQQQLDKETRAEEREEKRLALTADSTRASIAAQQASTQLGYDRLNFEKQKAADKTASGKVDPKMFMSGTMTAGLPYSEIIKATSYIPSGTDYAKAFGVDMMPEYMQEHAKQSWTPEVHGLNQMRNQVSEMLGRALSGAALSETKERPTWTNALLPTQAEIQNKDVNAIRRKESVYNALAIYANTFAETGRGALTVQDVSALGSGQAELMVDSETGIPVGMVYRNGRQKQF